MTPEGATKKLPGGRNADGVRSASVKRCVYALGAALVFGVSTLGSAAQAKITPIVPPSRSVPGTILTAYQPAQQSAPYQCPWSTHWQTGQCVTLTAPRVRYDDDPHTYLRFSCPATYPYVFESAFSAFPDWTDRSFGMGAAVRAVEAAGRKYEWLSFAGFDAPDSGYIAVESRALPFATEYEKFYTAGEYVCTNSYASPL